MNINSFVNMVQHDPDLQYAIKEHLAMADGNATTSTPPDEGLVIDYASTVFSSAPPSTIGRGEQVLPSKFLRSRKADTWKEFTAAEAQNPIPRLSNFTPTPTRMPSFASAPSQGVAPGDSDSQGDENDNRFHPKTVEEAYEYVQRVSDKWTFHMKASLLAEAELTRATAFCHVLGRGQQKQMSPGMSMPVLSTPVPVPAVQTPTFSDSGHPVVPNQGHTFPPRNKIMPGMTMNHQQQQQQRCMSSASTNTPDATSIFSGMNHQEKEESLMGLGIMGPQNVRFRHKPGHRSRGEGATGMLGPGHGQASRMA